MDTIDKPYIEIRVKLDHTIKDEGLRLALAEEMKDLLIDTIGEIIDVTYEIKV